MRSELHEPKATRGANPNRVGGGSRASSRTALDTPGLAPALVDAALAADSESAPQAVSEEKPSLGSLTAELRQLQSRQEEVLELIARTLPR